MSWLSRATGIKWDVAGDISKGAKALVRNPGEAISGGLGHLANQIGTAVGLAPSHENTLQPVKPAEQIQTVLQEQESAYQQYMKNLPSFQRKMAEGLAQQSMGQLSARRRGIEQQNVSRGLGYGALNESMKEQARAQAQQQLASSIQQGNLGLMGLGEQMQAGIVTTGAGMQADLQNRLNQLYQRQQAELAASNQMTGSFLGLLGTAAGAMLGGPGGAMVGGSIGQTVGSQIK